MSATIEGIITAKNEDSIVLELTIISADECEFIAEPYYVLQIIYYAIQNKAFRQQKFDDEHILDMSWLMQYAGKWVGKCEILSTQNYPVQTEYTEVYPPEKRPKCQMLVSLLDKSLLPEIATNTLFYAAPMI